MKKFWLIGVFLLAVVAMVGLAGCTATSSTTSAAQDVSQGTSGNVSAIFSNQQEGIWVNGSGKVTVTPDIVNLSLGVQDQEATVEAAQAKTVQAMNAIMNVLKSNNVADQDVKTQQFSITPVYQSPEPNKPSVITAYQVTNIVNVKVRDVSRAGAIIDAVASAGGDLTRINSISFSVDNPSQYYEQARKLAMTDAADKAKQLADLSGVTLGKPTYISESSSSPVPVRLETSMAPASTTPISAGSMDITINVQVAYAILK